MKALAEQIIERLLLVEDTYDQLLDVENQELATEARLQVLQQMLHQEEVDDKIEITDGEIQSFYDGNAAMMSAPPQMRIRYIRIGLGNNEDEAAAARVKADEAYKKLVPGLFQEGEDFATVAQGYSEDPETAANGGEFPGWIGESTDILTEIELHPFHEMILGLPAGEISNPFEFGGSLYIVQVIERTEPELLSLDEARPYIEEILNLQKHDELLAELQEKLLEEADFVIYYTVVEDYLLQLSAAEITTPSP
jgi:parvulin-like peptidyl-prolyl isomerase